MSLSRPPTATWRRNKLAAIEKRQELNLAYSALRDSSNAQRTAFNNLGGLVQTDSNGSATYILSCGYGVRSNGTPAPPVEDPPYSLRTKVNGTPGKVLLSWLPPTGARYFEAQSTTDLSGESRLGERAANADEDEDRLRRPDQRDALRVSRPRLGQRHAGAMEHAGAADGALKSAHLKPSY